MHGLAVTGGATKAKPRVKHGATEELWLADERNVNVVRKGLPLRFRAFRLSRTPSLGFAQPIPARESAVALCKGTCLTAYFDPPWPLGLGGDRMKGAI